MSARLADLATSARAPFTLLLGESASCYCVQRGREQEKKQKRKKEKKRGRRRSIKGERVRTEEGKQTTSLPASSSALPSPLPPVPLPHALTPTLTHRLKCGGAPLPPAPPPPRLSLALVAFCWNRLASSNAFAFTLEGETCCPFPAEMVEFGPGTIF